MALVNRLIHVAIEIPKSTFPQVSNSALRIFSANLRKISFKKKILDDRKGVFFLS